LRDRLVKVETEVPNIKEKLNETKSDLKDLENEVKDISIKLYTYNAATNELKQMIREDKK
jgi:archaellum component FlaC